MPRVTKEQIAKAREWDLLSYLQAYEPHELKRSGLNEYCTKTHDSLKYHMENGAGTVAELVGAPRLIISSKCAGCLL